MRLDRKKLRKLILREFANLYEQESAPKDKSVGNLLRAFRTYNQENWREGEDDKPGKIYGWVDESDLKNLSDWMMKQPRWKKWLEKFSQGEGGTA